MNERKTSVVGMGLLILGGLVLLGNGIGGALVGALGLGAAGVVLTGLYDRKRRPLWAFIVGFGLLGLAAAALVGGALAGSAFLGLLAAGFALAYRRAHARWWALIPAGVLATLALVAGAEALTPFDGGPLFFLGIAATFGYLYILPEGPKRWAIYPALGAAVLTLLSGPFPGAGLLPLVLIGIGVYLLRERKETPAPEDKPAPSPEVAPAATPPSTERPGWDEVLADLETPGHAETA